MGAMIQMICFVMLGALLCYAAVSDAQRRIIPNWLTICIAVLAIPYWIGIGLVPWPGIALQVGLAVAVFAIFATLFAFGMMGGGDVKLLAALALWLPLPRLVELIVIMSIAGGVLTLAMVVRHRLQRRLGQPEIPYGLAIVAAAAWAFSEPFLNHFGA
jgi:prepilin peptidase CpaA